MHDTTFVDFIRHGEPVGGRRIRGQSDDPLSERGWQQLWHAVGQTPPWHAVVSSPLCRCLDFARALSEKHGLSLQVEPRFKEIGFGSWEGVSHAELTLRAPLRYPRFRDDPLSCMPSDAENLSLFTARVAAAWAEVCTTYAGRRVLVVCHAGVIRAMLVTVLGMAPEYLFRAQVDYASITRFAMKPERPPILIAHAAPLQ